MTVYPQLAWVKRQLRHNSVARLSRRRTILAVFIIGSEARGMAGPDSDLDIAVVIGGRKYPSAFKITENYHSKFLNATSVPR
jgi:predicted nucleotidyltransferase